MRVTFRRASLSDAQAIADLITEVAQQVILPGFSAQGRTQFMLSNNAPAILQFMQDGFCYWVAECDELDPIVPVRQASVHSISALIQPSIRLCGVLGMKNQQHLYHLFVAVSMQRQGIARQLWQLAKAHYFAVQIAAWQRTAMTTKVVTDSALPDSAQPNVAQSPTAARSSAFCIQQPTPVEVARQTPSLLPITVNSSLYAVAVYQRWGFVPTATPQTINGVIFVPMQWVAAQDDVLSASSS
jgi:GNAT superfamily N-acetyltransferase